MHEEMLQLIKLRNNLRWTAEEFCNLVGLIDGTSDAKDLAKIEYLLESAMSSFDDTPIVDPPKSQKLHLKDEIER